MEIGKTLTLCCFLVIAISLFMPAYADVQSIKTDKDFYVKGSKITFSGTVDEDDVGHLVTIVIRNPSNEFVLLTQAYTTLDKTFERIVDTDSKFKSHGIYNATAFIANETDAMTVSFDFSLDGSPVIHPKPEVEPEPEISPEPQVKETQETISTNEETETSQTEKSIYDKIKERIENAKKQREVLASPSPSSSEAEFDSTTDNHDTTEAQLTTSTDETKITPLTSTPVSSIINAVAFDLDSNSIIYSLIAVGSAGGVATAIYSIKNKTKHNLTHTKEDNVVPYEKPSTEDDYALMILKNRLAKGEITVEEYNTLKKAIKEP